jgi:Tfp pilus assembly protein PilV
MQQLIRPLRQRFKQQPMRHPKHARQLGIALLEALMALVILAFGVLGLLWLHQQALAQQRQQLMRSVAMGVAECLSRVNQRVAGVHANYFSRHANHYCTYVCVNQS